MAQQSSIAFRQQSDDIDLEKGLGLVQGPSDDQFEISSPTTTYTTDTAVEKASQCKASTE